MAVAPICNRCSKPHYNFVACDKAVDWQAKRAVRVTGPPLSSVIRSVPGGFRAPTGWGEGERWGAPPDAPRAA